MTEPDYIREFFPEMRRLRATSLMEPYMTDAMPTPDLQAICDSCLQPIADGEGHVWVDQHAADTAARRTRPLLIALKIWKIFSTATIPCPGTPPTQSATTCPIGHTPSLLSVSVPGRNICTGAPT